MVQMPFKINLSDPSSTDLISGSRLIKETWDQSIFISPFTKESKGYLFKLYSLLDLMEINGIEKLLKLKMFNNSIKIDSESVLANVNG